MFYGYQGWYNNPLVSQLALDERYFSVGEGCFYACDGITEVNIPNHFTEIANEAFLGCSNVTTLTLPADLQYGNGLSVGGVKTIRYTPGATGVMPDRPYYHYQTSDSENAGCYAPEFQSGVGLLEIVFDDGITHIASYLCQSGSYKDYHLLYYVTLPSTLKSIGEYAFSVCYNAEFYGWPTGLISIGKSAFYNCQMPGDLTFTGDAPTIGENAFYNGTVTSYYPASNSTWTECPAELWRPADLGSAHLQGRAYRDHRHRYTAHLQPERSHRWYLLHPLRRNSAAPGGNSRHRQACL